MQKQSSNTVRLLVSIRLTRVPYAGLGNVYLDQTRYKDAVAQYQHAIELKGDYTDALMPLGYALVRLNRLPEAIEKYNQALKVEPDNPEIHNNLGYLYNHTKRYDAAVAACLEAIDCWVKLERHTSRASKRVRRSCRMRTRIWEMPTTA